MDELRAPDFESAAEPMEDELRPSGTVRWLRLTLSGARCTLRLHTRPRSPAGWGKLMERAPRAVVYMWIPHQPCSVCRDPTSPRGPSRGRTHG